MGESTSRFQELERMEIKSKTLIRRGIANENRRLQSYRSSYSFNSQRKRIRAILIKTCGNSNRQNFVSMYRNNGLHDSMTIRINTSIRNLQHAIIRSNQENALSYKTHSMQNSMWNFSPYFSVFTRVGRLFSVDIVRQLRTKSWTLFSSCEL